MSDQQALPRFAVLTGVEVVGNTITINTALPDRGLGYNTDDLRKWFKEDLLRWALEHGGEVRGKVVRLNGPTTVPAAVFAGVLVNELYAERIEQSTIKPGEWLIIAAHNDREAPLPVRYKPGHVVRAQVFGHEVPNLVIRGYSLGDQFQLCGMDNREQVWVAKADILAFQRRLARYEESKFNEIPRFRKPFEDLGLRNGQRVRFMLFGNSCTGRVSAIRPAS